MENFWNESLDFKIQQKKNEWIDFMLEISKEGKLKNCLEIGCYDGGTTVFLSNFCQRLITIDQPYPARFDEYKYTHNSDLYGTEYLKTKCDFNYVSGNSHELSTLDKVKLILGEDKLDLLFIDGDHSYNGVKMDYEMYSHLVKNDGYIAFHDIHRSQFHESHGCFVHDFWDEIHNKHENKVFYDSSSNSHWGGIGLIKIK
jgi:predicted O-methyltransferase YrrM